VIQLTLTCSSVICCFLVPCSSVLIGTVYHTCTCSSVILPSMQLSSIVIVLSWYRLPVLLFAVLLYAACSSVLIQLTLTHSYLLTQLCPYLKFCPDRFLHTRSSAMI
jgi:hypothetical protein